MKIREAGQEAGRASGSFVASRRSRILKPQKFFELSKICQDKVEPHPFRAGCGRWSESFEAAKLACGQCPHFGLRTRSCRGRIGPDCACFRGRPVFAGEGMQFESHLGHCMTPRQRGFCFNVWTLTPLRVPLMLSAVCAWRRGGLFGCVGGGVRVLAGGPSACWNLGLWVVLSCCFRWPVVGRHSFMAKSCGDDMTQAEFSSRIFLG
jgi:hypothetical protein